MTMDVDTEIAAANRRIQRQIDRDARAALIRIGVNPDAEALAAYIESTRELIGAFAEALGTLGEVASTVVTTFAQAMDALKAGDT